jgi:DNA-binding response OmpR family regulator/DNA-binding transcriptional ArsR family regulator
MRVLVVDNDAVTRDELSGLLREDQHTVDSAPSVAKAVELLEHDEFEVVITDLRMPRQNGLELLRECRTRWPRTLVVVITGFATVETALEAMKLGAFDYVRKPFRIEQLRDTLRLAAQEHEFQAPEGTRRDPPHEAEGLAATGQYEVLFLGEPAPTAGPHLRVERFDPDDSAGLVARVGSFVTEHMNAAVVLSGAERLLQRHSLEEAVGVLERLRAILAGHGPLRVGFNPHLVDRSVAMALGGAVVSDDTHATLDALANPIRRAALGRLAQGPAPFGELMRAAGLDDSPKMSFHVRRLLETNLLLHEGERYRLTTRGEATVRLLIDAAFLPPTGHAGNLAFPKEEP